MASPTFVNDYETTWSSWTGATSKTTSSFDVVAADVLVVLSVVENHLVSLGTPTNTQGAETWILQQEVNVNDYCRVKVWTAVMSGAKTGMTVSIFQNVATINAGFTVHHWTDSNGVGVSNKTNVSSGAPSLGLTTTVDESAISLAVGDWNALDGTSRTWRSVNGSAATELTYHHNSAAYTVYVGSHTDVGAADVKTVGLSAPSGQKYSIAAVEILGIPDPPATGPMLMESGNTLHLEDGGRILL